METIALKRPRRILLVDDEAKILEITSPLLRRQGYEVTTAQSGDEAVLIAEEQSFNLIITDMEMPGLKWESLLQKLLAVQPHTPVILLTAHGTVERGMDLIRLGAFDLVAKPYDDKDLLLRIFRALEVEALIGENRELKKRLRADDPELVVGDTEIMGKLLDQVATVAATDFPVLLTGESGTGKEMVARYIHKKSARRDGPFIAVNCAAVPAEIFESEFFGHARGSFTGAHADRKGLFEAAENGTIFLDEIAEIGPESQVKLLRVLQESEVKRVGEQTARRIDARLICATNRDMKAAVRQGQVREDLYYRINVFPVLIPPLRERPGDIPPLAQHLIARSREELGRNVIGISRAAIDKLRSYSWPGNVRQLENTLKQAMVRATGERVEAEDVILDDDEAEAAAPPTADGLTLREARDRFTRTYLESLLDRLGGNVSRAAEQAGKHRSDFYELLNRFGIDPSRFRKGTPEQSQASSSTPVDPSTSKI